MGMMINRRRVCGGKGLPYDAEIEYLESDGNFTDALTDRFRLPYIPTGYDNEIHISFMFKGWTSNSRAYNGIFQSFSGNDNNTYSLIRNNTSNTQFCIGNGIKGGRMYFINTIGLNTKYNLILKTNGTYILNGNTYNMPTTPKGIENTDKIHIYLNMKVVYYSFYIIKNNILVLDVIPVRIGTVGYLYDKITKTILDVNRTGSLILGPDV